MTKEKEFGRFLSDLNIQQDEILVEDKQNAEDWFKKRPVELKGEKLIRLEEIFKLRKEYLRGYHHGEYMCLEIILRKFNLIYGKDWIKEKIK